MRSLLLLSLALAPIQTAQAGAQESGFDVALFRTRRGPELTVVDGVLEFDPRRVEGGTGCGYVVALSVMDTSGVVLLRDSWRGVLACEQAEEDTESAGRTRLVVETFQFAVMPGQYSLELSLQPEGKPDEALRLRRDIDSLTETAVASDLILAREVGWVDTTEASRWTVQKGNVGIAADPYAVVDPGRPSLAYYLEAYAQPEIPLQGTARCVIRRATGEEVVRTEVGELAGDAQSRPIAGTLSLAGLPPGSYTLEVRLELADTVVTRSRDFAMATDVAALASARPPADTGKTAELNRYLSGLSDEELTDLFDPIVVWLGSQRERDMYQSLNGDGKRRFLAMYFADVAPKLLGGDEAALDIYLERVRHVRQAFPEKAGRESGWRTDRGRIYLLRGEPDQKIVQVFPPTNSPPYEIWGYDIGPRYVYLFIDETRFDYYRLVFSTDPSRNPLPDWETRAGPAALADLERYFAVRPRFRGR